jgi:hypothetical protein
MRQIWIIEDGKDFKNPEKNFAGIEKRLNLFELKKTALI